MWLKENVSVLLDLASVHLFANRLDCTQTIIAPYVEIQISPRERRLTFRTCMKEILYNPVRLNFQVVLTIPKRKYGKLFSFDAHRKNRLVTIIVLLVSQSNNRTSV